MEIDRCWNPECNNGLTQLECAPKGDGAIWHIYCYGCGACSPYFDEPEEAISFHRRIIVVPEWVISCKKLNKNTKESIE